MSQIKKCNRCAQEKHVDSFYKDSASKDGYYTICKQCKNESTKKSREKLHQRSKLPTITHKDCARCKEYLPVCNFTKLKSNITGYAVYCKQCRKLNDYERKQKNPCEINAGQKICQKCNLEKDFSKFHTTRKSSDGVYNTCKDCWPKSTWTREKARLSERKYYENNKEKVRAKWRRQGQNINRRVRNSLNSRIRESLLNFGNKKDNVTRSYLGCSFNYLRKWIEFQFDNDMSWDNYGQWHLDHVTPVATFDLSNDANIRDCFHWSNLRPCWATQNIQKGDKMMHRLIEKHRILSENYQKQYPLPNHAGDRHDGPN